tara:strand:- start:2485 stop:2868 length:384 start_codon:yes stop_codon:yes gene_type:complete
MESILLSDVNMKILDKFLCCDNHFNLLININKKIKNNFINNPDFIKYENEKNKNLLKIYIRKTDYYKSRFFHLRNSINIAMNQNIYLFDNDDLLTEENNFDTETETDTYSFPSDDENDLSEEINLSD